jgi:hypothetical protein
MIRQKNRIHRKAKHFKNPMHWNKFRKIRNEVTCLVRNTKDKSNNDLIQKITNMNASCKNGWNIVKQISGIKGSDMSIPPILHNDNLIFDDTERANLFNIYFYQNNPKLTTAISLIYHRLQTKYVKSNYVKTKSKMF